MTRQSEFIGVDLGGTNLRAGLIDRRGTIVRRLSEHTRGAEGKEKVIERIADLVRKLSDGSPVPVGVASPGPVDPEKGVLFDPPNLPGWGRVELRRKLEEMLGVRVYVQNDANMVAYGEFRFGAGRGRDNMLCITLGTGVGSGIILNRKLHQGEHGFAAELGHTVVDPNGPVCGCGARGCLESLVAAPALVREAHSLIDSGRHTSLRGEGGQITAEEIGLAAAKGDGVAKAILSEAGRYLGIAVSNAVALLDISLVVVGGGIANAGELIFKPARETVAALLIDYQLREIDIVPSQLGDDAGVLGIFAHSLPEN